MSEFELKYCAMRQSVIESQFGALNPMQRKAVLKTKGPLLLLAGAGSGKTTVLINRIINLLRFGSGYESEAVPAWAGDDDLKLLAQAVGGLIDLDSHQVTRLCAVDPPKPWEIIAITFTNKAAGELRDRLEVACGEIAADIWAQTFHTACLRILRPNVQRLGYSKGFAIYDEDDKKKLIKTIVKDMGYDEKRFEAKVISSEISRAKDSLLAPDEYITENEGDHFRKTVGGFYREYQKRMKNANAMDFDDIICQTVRLLRENQDIRESYQHKFKYVLVDEYQDTNHAQYVLCSLLAGKWRNLCVVGDDDQSIYKFRGATIANILEFEEQYPDAVSIRLEQNYRSSSNILGAANRVISNNFGRKGKNLWTDRGDGEKVLLYHGETQEEEAAYIAKTIFEGYSEGQKLKDFCILYRNHALSSNIEAAFARSSIPYRIVKGLRFLDRAEVKDMLAYLCVVSNPSDTLRLTRVINTPARKIGAKTVENLILLAEKDGISAFGAAENAHLFPELSRSCEALKSFAAAMNTVIARKFDTPLPQLYDLLLEQSGYLEALRAQNDIESQTRIENILELKSMIIDYCTRSPEPTLDAFLEEIALLADVDRYDQDADAVTLMTVHSAKGLEFENVFICGVEEGIFPSYRSMESDDEIEEERRLCYVAMTRAKSRLYLTCAKRRMLYGQTFYSKPSRFVEEIPEEYLDAIKVEAATPSALYTPKRVTRRPVGNAFPKSSFAPSSPGFSGQTLKAPVPATVHIGEKVRHKAFGTGVVKATTPMGGDTLLEIVFEDAGSKLMMAKTAMQFIDVL